MARMSPASLGSPTLLLVPTALERAGLEEAGGIPPGLALTALCGFGPIAAAARTAQLIGSLKPARVLLVGIAGSYDRERAPLGSALEFSAVAIEGLGAGAGESLRGPAELGFAQLSESLGPAQPIVERIALAVPESSKPALLLTTCAASDGEQQAALRKRRYAQARAEDMEGFGVALACALSGLPLRIVRGISNLAGDREHARWCVKEALASARELAEAVLQDTAGWGRPT